MAMKFGDMQQKDKEVEFVQYRGRNKWRREEKN